jgi:hypothetical protein
MDMDQQGEGIKREKRVSVVVQGTHVCLREDLGADVPPPRIPRAIRFKRNSEFRREA